jgi:catechol 2,3-dioxygenase-like lactoylglutathione lyase family enzyme
VPLKNLNHLLVLAQDLEATRDFYVDVLGLAVGPRPSFKFPGYWLYLGDQPVVHLSNKGSDSENAGTGPIDHIAFEATGLKEMVARLEELAISVHHRKVPDLGLHQVFINDPNGVKIELNYPASEGAEFEI